MVSGAANALEDSKLEYFESKIRPILVTHCLECHSAAKKVRGGLNLDNHSGLLKGGDTGAVIVPGKPELSLLINAVEYKEELKMPPRGKLSGTQIADLKKWVKDGAVWPDEKSFAHSSKKDGIDIQKRKQFWSWQFPAKVDVPKIQNDLIQTPVDAFIFERIQRENLKVAPKAAKNILLRRLYLDLVGLLPTEEVLREFENDSSPDAFEKVVDKLLASPAFGERWGRHWLDLVRYAESRGHEFDFNIPNAFQYRDYVIRAFNDEVPYDLFAREHIAGDLIPQPRLNVANQVNESIIGTGFYFLGEEVHSPVDIRQDQADRFDNRIDVFGKTFMGLTIACARCHDHKFDPILSKDYYSIFAFLESSRYRSVRFQGMTQNRAVARDLEKIRMEKSHDFVNKLKAELENSILHLDATLNVSRNILKNHSAKLEEIQRQALQKVIQEEANGQKLDPVLASRTVHALAVGMKSNDELSRKLTAAILESRAAKPMAKIPFRKFSDLAGNKKIEVDYSNIKPEQWLPDDVTFGTRPVHAGEVKFESGNKGLQIQEVSGARLDPFWKNLKVSSKSESDPGALGGDRAGKTITSPSFQVQDGFVHVLMQGKAKILCSVGSHVVFAGPLHGGLIRNVDQKQLGWVTFDLTRYKGLPVHIEVSSQDPDFALAMIAQGDSSPCIQPVDHFQNEIRKACASGESLRSYLKDGLQNLLTSIGQNRFPDGEEGIYLSKIFGLLNSLGLLPWGDPEKNPFSESEFQAKLKMLESNAVWDSEISLAMLDGTPLNEKVFIRGNHKSLGEDAPRAFLAALGSKVPENPSIGSGRLDLANWVTDTKTNPFFSRVMVNRVWHHIFGRGIVASVDNFGELGEKPTHAELLDYLALQFEKDGYSLKKLIRLMVTSRVYQSTSQNIPENNTKDPQNLLLANMRLKRMEGETIRDSMLEISGGLDNAMFGKSVPVYLSSFQEGRGRPQSGPVDGAGRKSIYIGVRRNFLSSFLLAFDAPIPFSTVGRRSVSNVPAQALIMMNDPFVHQQAKLWAAKVIKTVPDTDKRLESMFIQAFSRKPQPLEIKHCLEHLENSKKDGDEVEVWASLAHAIWNAKEFIWVN